MNSSLRQALLDEFDETEDDVRATSASLQYFGFDKLVTKARNFQAIVNRNVTARNEKSRS